MVPKVSVTIRSAGASDTRLESSGTTVRLTSRGEPLGEFSPPEAAIYSANEFVFVWDPANSQNGAGAVSCASQSAAKADC